MNLNHKYYINIAFYIFGLYYLSSLGFFFLLQKCFGKLKEWDKVKVWNPYDGCVSSIEIIHSPSILYGANLNEIGDANTNIVMVTSNISFSYEDKIDRAICLKEKEGTFTL